MCMLWLSVLLLISKISVTGTVSSVTTTQTPVFQTRGHTLNFCTNQVTKYGKSKKWRDSIKYQELWYCFLIMASGLCKHWSQMEGCICTAIIQDSEVVGFFSNSSLSWYRLLEGHWRELQYIPYVRLSLSHRTMWLSYNSHLSRGSDIHFIISIFSSLFALYWLF